MEIKSFNTEFTMYENRNELPAESAALLNKAHEAAQHAYAPYSRFKVGAAILLENGEIVIGSNQENAAYPSGICAERTAAFSASALYPNIPFKKIAIIAINLEKPLDEPISPCGACRQVLLEYEQKYKKPLEMILSGETGHVYVFKSIHELLPCSFHSGFLPKE